MQLDEGLHTASEFVLQELWFEAGRARVQACTAQENGAAQAV